MPVNASSLLRISVDNSGTSANNIATGGVMSADGRYVVFQSTATNLVGTDVNGFFDVFLRDTLTGTTTLLSTATGGTQGNNVSSVAAITDDGRYIFFNSTANNLVGGDSNAALDVFMRDTLTGVTTRVSTDSVGSQVNGASQNVDVTGDGAFIGFQSTATNLVGGDSNGFSDAFIKNLTTGAVTRISVADDESQGNGNSLVARLSDDGNRVSFVSSASNLTANDSNGAVVDVFVRDIAAGTTTLVSVSTGGGSGDGQSSAGLISGNGRYVVFQSDATNLVAGDTNAVTDIFVRDLQTNTTTRVSTATDGSQANELSGQAVISADGRYVVFFSLADNLVQGDTNGLRDVFLKDLVTGNVTRLSVALDGGELNDISNMPAISADGRYVTFQTQATDTGVGAEGNGTGFDVFRVSLVASAVSDRMIGSDGSDTIDGLAGDDILFGGFGNDVLTGSAGADQLMGSAGIDTADYSDSMAGITVNLLTGTASGGDAQGDTLAGTENVIGSVLGDTLTGDGGANTLTGGDGNDVLEGGAGVDTLSGGKGIDTASYIGSAIAVAVNLQTGVTSGGDAQNDVLSAIENLAGSSQNDILTGDGNANRLDGSGGADTMTGLAGNDTYVVDDDNDEVVEAVGGGFDMIEVGHNYYVLAAGQEVERIVASPDTFGTVTLFGNEFDNELVGSPGDNILNGGDGDDVLIGDVGADTLNGGAGSDTANYGISDDAVVVNLLAGIGLGGDAAGDTLTSIENVVGSFFDDTLTGNGNANRLDGVNGADTMTGLAGNDTYVVDDDNDEVVEAIGGGFDTIEVTNYPFYALAAGQEIEKIMASPDTLSTVILSGNEFDNELVGSAGVNILNGGTGADIMIGLGGDENYYVDNVGDQMIEDVGEGFDSAFTTVSYVLAAGQEVEFISILDFRSTTALDLTGNEFGNWLGGNAGANVLDGGAGADTLGGFAGADTYIFDNDGDVVEDISNAGDIDRVFSSVAVDLSDTDHFIGDVEAVQLMGSGDLDITGNALRNYLLGNQGANIIDGGVGADSMWGRGGNDTYIVDNILDLVDESLGGSGGIDLIQSSVSFNMGSQSRGIIETLELTGSANVNAIGNSLANILIGNAGANIAAGGGGDDTLTGGGGNDVFLFNSTLNPASNVDTIIDMNEAGNDTIWLDAAVFTALAAGTLIPNAFAISAAGALDATDRIIYNDVNGELSYDADGTGAAASILFAILDTGLNLTYADFRVV